MNGPVGRLFRLIRDDDETGISGDGHVASGVCWPDGSVTLKWHTNNAQTANINHYPHMLNMLGIHGHGGKTRRVWVRDEKAPAARLIEQLGDFAYELGDFTEKTEKGLSPKTDPIRMAFGRLLDTAQAAKGVA
jgi:hypothetical protein